MTGARPRIFLGTVEIAGYYEGLYRGFLNLGFSVSRYFRYPHPFGYNNRSLTERALQKLSAKFIAASDATRRYHPSLFLAPDLEEWLVRHIIKSHDIFIFGFMTSLDGIICNQSKLRDLQRIKEAGKTIICVFHGSDIRPVWLNGGFLRTDPKELVKNQMASLVWLRTIEKYADVIVSHPPMGQLQTRPYAQYLSVGIPTSAAEQYHTEKNDWEKGKFRIVHAPSNPQAKGTGQIKKVIERLRLDGYEIDFQFLINVDNKEVLKTLHSADLLVDQVFSDTPMAHLATEAATQGCATVVCGHDLNALRDTFPSEAWPPSIIGRPDELYDCVKWALDNDAERRAMGRAAQNFVFQRWRPEQVAKNFLRLAREGVPKDWLFCPKNKQFWGGYGMTLDQRDCLVDRIISVTDRDAVGIPSNISIPLPRQ